MKCSIKFMSTTAVALIAALATVYFIFPETQAFLLAALPILAALLCPIAMGVMMFAMRGHSSGASSVALKVDAVPLRKVSNAVHEA